MTVFDNLALPLREHDAAGRARDRRRGARPPRGRRPARRRRPAAEPALGRHGEARLAGAGHHPEPGRAAVRRAVLRARSDLVRRIEALLASINRTRGITTVVVSHDIDSTMRMAERVLLLLAQRVRPGRARPSCEPAPIRTCARSYPASRPRSRCRRRADGSAIRRLGAATTRMVADLGRHGASCRGRARRLHPAVAPAQHRRRGLQARRALAPHHLRVRARRRHGARPPGVQHAGALRRHAGARRGGRPEPGARARARC